MPNNLLNIFKSKTWDIFSFQIIVLVLTYFILFYNATSNIENFQYKWTKLHSGNDATWLVKADYYSSRKSFTDTYSLDIFHGDQFISSINCDGIKFEKYCKTKYQENGTLPIIDLIYEKGLSPSNKNVTYRIYSFNIIENNELKKIKHLSPTYQPNKQSSYLFTSISFLLNVLAHLWILRSWLKTRTENFYEYLLVKIGLPITTAIACMIFMQQVNTYY